MAEPAPDDAEYSALFKQLQAALLGQTFGTALEAMTAAMGGLIASAASNSAHARRIVTAVSNDLPDAVDLYWADGRANRANQTGGQQVGRA